MGKRTDRWIEMPVAAKWSKADMEKMYEAAKIRARHQKNAPLPWARKYQGKNYFYMGTWENMDVRQYKVDELRDAGFLVRVVDGHHLYARKNNRKSRM